MNKTFRASGLALLLAAALGPARASLLTFDDLGTTPDASTPSGALIGTHYQSATGVVFEDTGRVFNYNPPPPLGSSAGYLSNLDERSFGFAVDSGFNYSKLVFDLAMDLTGVNVTVTLRDGTQVIDPKSGSTNGWFWRENVTYDFSSSGSIARVDFKTTGGPLAYVAIDNIELTGNNVPEPASFGLAIIALTTAGLSMRRRRS